MDLLGLCISSAWLCPVSVADASLSFHINIESLTVRRNGTPPLLVVPEMLIGGFCAFPGTLLYDSECLGGVQPTMGLPRSVGDAEVVGEDTPFVTGCRGEGGHGTNERVMED